MELRKKAKIVIESAASEFMSIVPDDLLLEKLVRLPDCRSAIQCSLICKRWYSLISNLAFVRSFRLYRHPHDQNSAAITLVFRCIASLQSYSFYTPCYVRLYELERDSGRQYLVPYSVLILMELAVQSRVQSWMARRKISAQKVVLTERHSKNTRGKSINALQLLPVMDWHIQNLLFLMISDINRRGRFICSCFN